VYYGKYLDNSLSCDFIPLTEIPFQIRKRWDELILGDRINNSQGKLLVEDSL
jgi:hypothetical protein